jgi:hypothetical protein
LVSSLNELPLPRLAADAVCDAARKSTSATEKQPSRDASGRGSR